MPSRRPRWVAFAFVFSVAVTGLLGQAPSGRLVGVVTDVDSHAGETFSGSLVTNPADLAKKPGLNVTTVPLPDVPGARPGQSPDVSRLVIDFGDGNVQPADRPFRLAPPAGSAAVPFTVRVLGQPAAPGASSSIMLAPGPPPPLPDSAFRPTFEMPSTVMPREVRTLFGTFAADSPGLLDTDSDGTPIMAVVATRRGKRILFPSDLPAGPHRVTVDTPQGDVVLPVNVITLTMTADRLTLLRGQSTAFHVTISGPDRFPDSSWRNATAPSDVNLDLLRRTPGFSAPAASEEGRIFLRLENTTRQTVTMKPSKNEVELRSLLKNDFRNGPYRLDGVITSKVAGDFGVDGLVVAYLAPVTASPSPRPRIADPGTGRFRGAVDEIRDAMNRGLDGEKIRQLISAAGRMAEHVASQHEQSWEMVAGAPEVEWLDFAFRYDKVLINIQQAYGKPDGNGVVRDLVNELSTLRSGLVGEPALSAGARQALTALAATDGDLLRALDAGNADAFTKAVQAARAAKHQIFDRLPEFAAPAATGLPRSMYFDFVMAAADALARARLAATPDTMAAQVTDSYDKNAVAAALGPADEAARMLDAQIRK